MVIISRKKPASLIGSVLKDYHLIPKLVKLGFIELPNVTRRNSWSDAIFSLPFFNFWLKGFSNLEVLKCSNNLLTDIDFTDLNPDKIKEIDLKNNKLSARKLTCFSKFVNLESITVDGSFHGSLEPLKNLTKLKYITIAGTNIDSGLEHLPVSVISISISIFGESSYLERENLGCQKIFAQLKECFSLTSYTNKRYSENDALEAWKLEEIFEQQIKPLDLKNIIPPKIKEKKADIIDILHSGKGTSAYLHDEIKEMRRKLSDYKKLEQYLQEARNLNINLEEIKFICKEDKNEIYKGVYKRLKNTDEYISKLCCYFEKSETKIYYYEIALKEFVHDTALFELVKHTVEIQKLTQRLLGRRHTPGSIKK
ncbi:6865_t:CDS:2 [Dentiscutata erythropus]|uniref:6865_t:CDS:1 n=1 Tax=Dentiscutata erythropus TaxID=1348616 RepID=A0A9N9ELK6_9GLOM|nr:6865_t:CDS:2 [Dentiscutata erythropus]